MNRTIPSDPNYRTYAFRRFKAELTNLSRLRWVFAFSQGHSLHYLDEQGIADNDRLMAAHPLPGYDDHKLQISVGEFRQEAEGHEDHFNLLLLVKACANMEDYLGRMAQIWAVGQGYLDPKDKTLLDRRGKAIIQPALVSNLESSLSYLQLLLNVKFGPSLGLLGKAYKLRCIAAHNGGVVDHEAIRLFPELKTEWGKPIRLKWPTLHEQLKAAVQSCKVIENAIHSRDRYQGELQLILGELIKVGEVTGSDEPNARMILRDKYGFHRIPGRKALRNILKLFSC